MNALTPESVAQMVAKERADWLLDAVACATQNRQFLRGEPEYDAVAGEAILLGGEKAISVAVSRATATLAAENATLRAERDDWQIDAANGWAAQQVSVKRNQYHYDRAEAALTELATLRASEAAAMDRVKVLTEALKETRDDLFYQLEAKRGPQFASEYPSIRRAAKALPPTADKEPKT